MKGRRRRSETALIRRALPRGQRTRGRRRLSVTAERGFAAVALGEGLTEVGVEVSIRVKGSTTVSFPGPWRHLHPLPFVGKARHRNLGRLASCQSAPQRLWVTLSRARDAKGHWESWYLVSNRPRRAQATAAEYARRVGCEQGLRDTTGELGFAQARSQDRKAWSRRLALFALAVLVGVSLGVKRLLRGGPGAGALLRPVAARRRGRGDLSLVSARVRLLHEDKNLFAHLSPHIQFNLDARLVYVS